MRRLLIIFLIPLVNFGFGHDIRMAIFEISERNEGLTLKVSMDKDDFYASLEKEFSSLSADNIEELSWIYLTKNLDIEVNETRVLFKTGEITFDTYNIHLTTTLNPKISRITKVKMTNTCLIDSIEGHDNIMKLKLNSRVRSFRLNKKRTSTIASYN